jgi:hypothetical protein
MPATVHALLQPDWGIGYLPALGAGLRGIRRVDRNELPFLWTNSYFVATVGVAPLAIRAEPAQRIGGGLPQS